MIDHYNAFISYKHAEEDIRVARTIQSDLEHFHIPRKIQKSTGHKKINRIFLDKDELGAASDLSTEISYALEHADHLIVICSTATKESRWVPREIEYFLRNHTRKQITTVLVNGEPEDVIPDILKYEDRTYKNINGREYTVRVPLEPLSCDYRLPRKQAKKQELPRLASKLLSCSYDELMNRRRAYNTRRLSIIFSVILAGILGFGGYLVYSKGQIQQNLEDSLRNQSLYLANESLYATENEQRILGIQLALEALPKDDDDERPVIPQAIRALHNSTLAYTTQYSYGIHTVWNYHMSGYIGSGDCALSESGRELAAWDPVGDIVVWDTISHEELIKLHYPKGIKWAEFLPGERLMIFFEDKVALYQTSDRTLLWELKHETYQSFDENCCIPLSDDTLLLATSTQLYRVSLADGTVKKKSNLPETVRDTSITYAKFKLSPDEKNLAITYYISDNVNYVLNQELMVFDLATEEHRELENTGYISRMAWGDKDHIIIAVSSDTMNASSSIGNTATVKTDHITLRCIGTMTMTERWNYDFTSTNVMYQSDFVQLPKNEAVAFYHANKCEIFRVSDGGKIASHNLNDPIVLVQDPDEDGWPFYVTSTGLLAFPNNTDSVTTYSFFTTDLKDVFFRPNLGFFAHPSNSTEILHYGLQVTDTDFTTLDRGMDIKNMQKNHLDTYALAALTIPDKTAKEKAETEDETLPHLYIADPTTAELRYVIPIQSEQPVTSTGSTLFGTYNGHYYMGYTQSGDGYRVLDVDLSSGETKTIELIKDEYVDQDACTMFDGKLYYCCKGGAENTQLYTYDLTSGETATYKIRDDFFNSNLNFAPIVLPFSNSVFISSGEDDFIVHLDGTPTEYLTTPESWRSKLAVADPVNKRFALTDDSRIRLTTAAVGEGIDIQCPATPLAMTFYSTGKKDEVPQLLVAYNSGSLCRYNAETGELLGQADFTPHYDFDMNISFLFDTPNNLMYMKLGSSLSVIDTETWYELAYMSRCLGYHGPTDRIYSYASPASYTATMGYFKHYSTYDLIRKAKDILQGAELSDEKKIEYGIEITTEEH